MIYHDKCHDKFFTSVFLSSPCRHNFVYSIDVVFAVVAAALFNGRRSTGFDLFNADVVFEFNTRVHNNNRVTLKNGGDNMYRVIRGVTLRWREG